MTGRHSNGEGTISRYQRDGKPQGWIGKLVLPSGTRKSVYGKTKPEVQRKLAALRREVEAGLHGTRDAEATVRAYLDMWYASHAPSLLEKTQRGYASYIKNHLGKLAAVTLSNLKAIDVQKHYTAELQTYSPTTVRHVHAMLRLAFKEAVRLDIIPRNPFDFVKAPGMRVKEYKTLSREQVMAMIHAAQNEPGGVLCVLGVTTGLREAEIAGLAWEDIDVAQSRLTVRNTMHCYAGNRFELGPTKSRTSRRTIPLQPSVMRMLLAHRAQQDEVRDIVGSSYSDAWPLVFRTDIGMPLRYEIPIRRLRTLLRHIGEPLFTKAFIAQIRFHDLRHTFATLLIEDGVPIRVVSELLGHSNIGITLQIYGHVTPKMQDMASTTIAGWLIEPQAPNGTQEEGNDAK